MNVNGLPNSVENLVAARPRKLDITAGEPAAPEGLSSVSRSASNQAQAAANIEAVGSISGVLSPEENQAVADLFGKLRDGYTFSGGSPKASAPPGSLINFSA